MDTAVGSLIALVIVAAALWVGIRWLVRSASRYRGPRTVTCPETKNPTIVEVDWLHAALTSTVGLPDIRLENCSRWPLKRECGQECLTALDVAPDQCLVSGVLMHWYRDKHCVYCKKTLTEVQWMDHRPALRNPAGELLTWDAVNLNKLGEVLETHSPVCWDCYITQSFRHDHPDLVVYRPWQNNTSADEGGSFSSSGIARQ